MQSVLTCSFAPECKIGHSMAGLIGSTVWLTTCCSLAVHASSLLANAWSLWLLQEHRQLNEQLKLLELKLDQRAEAAARREQELSKEESRLAQEGLQLQVRGTGDVKWVQSGRLSNEA